MKVLVFIWSAWREYFTHFRFLLGDLDLESSSFEKEKDVSELAGNFDASENIYGAYAMLRQNFGKDFLLVAGFRVEQTNLEYEGFRFDDEAGTLEATAKEERNLPVT